MIDRDSVENVVIFISDALRWDHTPNDILDRGMSYKSIAAGGYTGLSLPSIASGRYPSNHGVYSWRNTLPQDISLFGIRGIEVGFYNALGGPKDAPNHQFGVKQTELQELDSPFIYFERDYGGHAPYAGGGFEETYDKMIREIAGDTDETRRRYRRSIQGSVDRFNQRLEYLSENGLLENTLVIFASDHGEFLGERGLVGHGAPLLPELVYVPITFIHPSLPSQQMETAISHVDVLPSICDCLGIEDQFEYFDGTSIFGPEDPDGINYCTTTMDTFRNTSPFDKVPLLKDRFFFKSSSVWDVSGGHVYNEEGRLIVAPGLFIKRDWLRAHALKDLGKSKNSLQYFYKKYYRHGEPEFTKEEAESVIDNVENDQIEQEQEELQQETKDQLKELGYL